MEFVLFDPRPASLAAEQAKILALREQGYTIIGVEVTVSALAGMCDINIDPQHGAGGDPSMSAIALIAKHGIDLIPKGAQKVAFATVRPDVDSFGGIALLWWELQAPYSVQQHSSTAMRSRIQAIHISDTFSRGEWQPRELGTGENSYLAAIARCVSDFKISMRDRIEAVQRWLETGEEPSGYRQAYEREQGEILAAIARGETSVMGVSPTHPDTEWGGLERWHFTKNVECGTRTRTPVGGGRGWIIDQSGGYPIAVVQSRLRAATSVGYTQAPIVIALNPAFSMGGAPPIRKFTVCQYRAGYVDLTKVKDELASLEAGWGGSPTIIGSPQGADSNLPMETVVGIVVKYLL